MCGVAVESTSHIFFGCDVSRDVLRKICKWWNVDFVALNSFEDWEIWFHSIRMNLKLKKLFEGICFDLWWLLWVFRNKLIFDVDPPLKADIFDSVVSHTFNWCRSRCKGTFRWDDWLKNPHLISL